MQQKEKEEKHKGRDTKQRANTVRKEREAQGQSYKTTQKEKEAKHKGRDTKQHRKKRKRSTKVELQNNTERKEREAQRQSYKTTQKATKENNHAPFDKECHYFIVC